MAHKDLVFSFARKQWLQENRFEQSRNSETYTPEQARQLLAERRGSRQ